MTSVASLSAFIDQPTTRREIEEDQKTIRGIVFPTTVQDNSDIEPALGSPDVGEVGQPLLVRVIRFEIPVEPRRFSRTMYGWLPRDKGLVIFSDWSGAAMYSASQLRYSRAP